MRLGNYGKINRPFEKSDLEELLKDTTALWFESIQSGNETTEDEEQFRHVIGVIPYRSPQYPDTYFAIDSTETIPLEELNIDTLYSGMTKLIRGKESLQFVMVLSDGMTIPEEEIVFFDNFPPQTDE